MLVDLRQRIAEVEQTNGELIAYARGHAGAANAIHEAVLAVLDAESPQAFATIVTRDWPALLGVDSVAMAWSADGVAFAANAEGIKPFEPRLIARMTGMDRPVSVRQVGRGHPLFGIHAAPIRAEIVIRLAGARGIGMVLLGEHATPVTDAPAATRLLRFLGRATATMLERWPLP